MKVLGPEHGWVCRGPQIFPGFRVCRAALAQDAHHIFGSKNFSKDLRGKCRAGDQPHWEYVHSVMILRSWLVIVACNLVWLLVGSVYSGVFLFCYSFLFKTSFLRPYRDISFYKNDISLSNVFIISCLHSPAAKQWMVLSVSFCQAKVIIPPIL